MVVAMMQPTFLPWAGYFALMDASDQFVLLDDFQFQRQSFQQRNRLFVGPRQVGWVTVPVEHRGSADLPLLCDVHPVITPRFRTKLGRLLSQNYGFSEHFATLARPMQAIIEQNWQSLADLNIALIRELASMLNLSTVLLRSSEIGSAGGRSERVADLLRRVGATTYLASAGAEPYMREDGVFPLPDVDTFFQDYSPAAYEQRHSDAFVPYLSTLDLILQVGPDKALDTIRAGAREFAPWTSKTATA